jgi:hypothetical protein
MASAISRLLPAKKWEDAAIQIREAAAKSLAWKNVRRQELSAAMENPVLCIRRLQCIIAIPDVIRIA